MRPNAQARDRRESSFGRWLLRCYDNFGALGSFSPAPGGSDKLLSECRTHKRPVGRAETRQSSVQWRLGPCRGTTSLAILPGTTKSTSSGAGRKRGFPGNKPPRTAAQPSSAPNRWPVGPGGHNGVPCRSPARRPPCYARVASRSPPGTSRPPTAFSRRRPFPAEGGIRPVLKHG